MDMYDLMCLCVVLATLAFIYLLILIFASERKLRKEEIAYDNRVFTEVIEAAKQPGKVKTGASVGVRTPYHWSEY
ncbi:MAG: hypothetical protein NTX75_01240 [Proteobacteria bacterium]|nr:hypothetical protein [Pseudomonadota bacterium]